MFQFRRFPPYGYVFTVQWRDMTHAGLLHSDTCGSKSACDSPQLFAAYRVLLRPLMPRHSPCALCSLTIFWNYAFSNLRSCSLSSFENRQPFWNCSFLPKTFVLRIKTFEFLYFSHHFLLCSIFKIPAFACVKAASFLRNSPQKNPFSLSSDEGSAASKVFFCLLFFSSKEKYGGHKWTRTTDLTLIRRAL